MRREGQAGISIFQLLLLVALIWGGFTLYRSPPDWLDLPLNRKVDARAYFSHVLDGIEKNRVRLAGNTPETQACSGLTFRQPEPGRVRSCQYVAVTDDYYMLTVVGQSGEVFRYAGRGPK